MIAPPPDPSSILIRLIDAAERVVCCRPAYIELPELAASIGDLQSPVGAPLSPAPALLMQALAALAQGRYADQVTVWRMIAGALLPLVRDDLTRVIEARKRRIEPDVGTYRGGGR